MNHDQQMKYSSLKKKKKKTLKQSGEREIATMECTLRQCPLGSIYVIASPKQKALRLLRSADGSMSQKI